MKAPETGKGLIAWFAQNHVAANLLMVLIIVTGLYSIATITKKAMPDIDLPIDPGPHGLPRRIAPADVESGIVMQVEKAMRGCRPASPASAPWRPRVRPRSTCELDDSYRHQ
jgi:hypothetical protein